MTDETAEADKIDVHAIVAFILTGDEKDVQLIRKALSLRAKTLTEMKEIENAHSIYVGDRVHLRRIKPQYLNGMVGTVTHIEADYFTVELFNTPKNGGRVRKVPYSCVEKYL